MLLLYKVEGDNLNDSQMKHDFKLSEVVIIVLITCTFSIFAGISYGKYKYSDSVNINNLSIEEENDGLNEFIKQYKYIINHYYDSSKIDEKELLNVALKSILSELGMSDNYSSYMDEEQYNELNINLNGKYDGLGIRAYKENNDGYIIVLSVIEDSPASLADIKEGDYIKSIDGKDTDKMSTQEFSQYVLQSDSKKFVLKLIRDKEEISVNINKSSIELKSVESKIIENNNKNIGYIQISIFASNTYNQFKQQLESLEKDEIDSLIIDLRNNSGGHLKEVTKILNLFLDKQNVIYQLQKDDEPVKYYSKGNKNKEYPIIFLSNNATASASEVFIISLKENLGAKVVGTKTFGKGTVQELIQLENGDQYKITTKKWLSPQGVWVNETGGIEPDVNVSLNSDYLKNPNDSNDNQLKKAIEMSSNDL